MGIKLQPLALFLTALFLGAHQECLAKDKQPLRQWEKPFFAFKSRFVIGATQKSKTNYEVEIKLLESRNKSWTHKPGIVWRHQVVTNTDPRFYFIENELVAGGFFGWLKTESDLEFESFFFLSPSGKVLTFPRPPLVIFNDKLLTYSYTQQTQVLSLQLISASTGAIFWSKKIKGDFSGVLLTSQWQKNPDCFDLSPIPPLDFNRLTTEEKNVVQAKIVQISHQDYSFCFKPKEKIKDRQNLKPADPFPLKEEYRIPVNSPNFLRQFSSGAP